MDSLRQQDSAWLLFPTGRTPWGLDWHGPSNLNVQSALEALTLLPGVPIEFAHGTQPDIDRLIYTGHSNGGQGAWWYTSHFPDSVLAGILSIFMNQFNC